MKRLLPYFFLLMMTLGCGKSSFTETDPATGLPPTPLTQNGNDTCKLVRISQINGNVIYNELSYTRDNNYQTIAFAYKETTGGQTFIQHPFIYNKDSIFIDKENWMKKNTVTGVVTESFHTEKNKDTILNQVRYEYVYDSKNLLSQKKAYYNGAKDPDYVTQYIYAGTLLVKCEVFIGNGTHKLMQTDIEYDPSEKIKPWMYFFADAFESSRYLNGFNFGRYAEHPVKQISTKVFDVISNSVLDTWVTNFSGYVFSTDRYVLQVTTSGHTQQGLSHLIGTMRFAYQCK